MAFANRLTFCAVLAGLCLTSASAQWYAFDYHPAGMTRSVACGGRGDLLVGQGGPSSPNAQLGLMWVNGSPQTLAPFSSTNTLIRRTDGWDAVGYASFGGGQQATMWFGQGALAASLAPRKSVASGLFDLDHGRQVGYYRLSSTGSMAAIWSGTYQSVVNIHPAGSYTESIARGIWEGTQVGSATDPSGFQHACRWFDTATSFLDMHPARFNGSLATDVDADIACGFAYDNMGWDQLTEGQAMVWDTASGAATNIHPGGFIASKAWAVNSRLVVGYMTDSMGSPRAVLWDLNNWNLIDLQTVLDSYSPFYIGSQAMDVWYDEDYVKVCGLGYDMWTGMPHAVAWMGLL